MSVITSPFWIILALTAPAMVQSQPQPNTACHAPPGAFGSVQKMDVSMEGKIFLPPNKPDNQYLVSLKDLDGLPSSGSILPGLPVSIEGHTDNVGDPGRLNQVLSQQRAEAVKRLLDSDGKVPGFASQPKGSARPNLSRRTPRRWDGKKIDA